MLLHGDVFPRELFGNLQCFSVSCLRKTQIETTASSHQQHVMPAEVWEPCQQMTPRVVSQVILRPLKISCDVYHTSFCYFLMENLERNKGTKYRTQTHHRIREEKREHLGVTRGMTWPSASTRGPPWPPQRKRKAGFYTPARRDTYEDLPPDYGAPDKTVVVCHHQYPRRLKLSWKMLRSNLPPAVTFEIPKNPSY